MQQYLEALRKYIGDIEKELATGKATEPTYYPALKGLLGGVGTGITATVNPKAMECGAPDFVVGRGEVTIGYVEAKGVGKSLDAIEADARRATPTTHDGDQLRRFLPLGNLVLTNYLEFRWYVDGERRAAARLGAVGLEGKVKRDKKGMEAAGELLGDFLAREPVVVGTPKELAVRMARLCHTIRGQIVDAFGEEGEGGALHGQFMAFREHLIPDLSVEQFADMYAQTIAYGLFAARATGNGGQKFSRQNAAYLVPKTNPFLRKLFTHIAGPELDDRIVWAVDDLAQVLGRADMAAVLGGFGRQMEQKDPVVNFYEDFLRAYDPKEKKLRGVYYTPEPVVSYIVRSVDYLLRTRFGRPLGLADPSVLVLDPAVGTGTFLYDAVKLVHESLRAQGQQGAWNNYVAEKLLPRLFGFELLMAPYAVAHLKLGLLLQELGYAFQGDQRLGVYLTNALGEEVHPAQYYGMVRDLAEEGNAATEVKREKSIMVVLGNPPYAGQSANRSEMIVEVARTRRVRGQDGKVRTDKVGTIRKKEKTFIGRLIEDYKVVDGVPLGEKNPKWLQDDYVKFLRFGQWRIDRTSQGVLGFITNHSYLDNPTFRGMRQSLMKTFTDIYILDLHGNERKRERCPDGSPDKNVFDIKQGVAIGIFVKEPGKAGPARVHHADLWGLGDGKCKVLAETDVAATEWKEVAPKSPDYLFARADEQRLGEYRKAWKVTGIFPVNNVGVVTSRDHFVLGFAEQVLRERIAAFRGTELTDDEVRERFGLNNKPGWSVSDARKALRSDGEWEKGFARCLYRPFDVRAMFYHDAVIERSRREVMRHMLGGANLALVSARSNKSPSPDHFYCSRFIVETKCGESTTQSYTFPLYLYPVGEGEQRQLELVQGRHANLNPDFVGSVSGKLGLRFVEDGRGDLEETFGPEDVFYYTYAVFYSPTYRNRYGEFLKSDFPRLPLTSDKKLFAALGDKGAELVGLHLMESKVLGGLITKWPVAGSDTVEKVRYDEKERRVWINGTQYFEGVPPEVWESHIGGYQVCEKWLKDRKGRKLWYDDVQHYQRVVVALAETIRLMGEIDAIIPGWPLE